MNRLVRAELLKAGSLRSTWALSAAAVVFCVLWVVAQVLILNAEGDAGLPPEQQIQNVYQMAQQGYLFVLVLGILGIAGEHRHQSITWSFLVSPRRERVVAAKLAAYGTLGLGVAVACAAATAAAAAAALAATGQPVTAPGIPLVLLGSVLSTTLYAILGVGLGALIRSQIAAVAVAFFWFFYAEFLLVFFVPEVGRWVPTGAAKAVSGWHLPSGDLLPAWAGGTVFLGYALAAAAVGYVITVRRDVA